MEAGVPTRHYFDTGRSGGLHGGAEYSATTRQYTLGLLGAHELRHLTGPITTP